MASIEAGDRRGKLVALLVVDILPNRQRLWLCQCDCGELTLARSGNMNSGNTSSCGCGQREAARDMRLAIGVANRLERDMAGWTAKQLRAARIEHNGAREPWDRMEIYLRDKGICQDCHVVLSPFCSFQIDHIIPVSVGGPDAPWNLQLLCVDCNQSKYDQVYGQTPCYCSVTADHPIGHPPEDTVVIIDCWLPGQEPWA